METSAFGVEHEVKKSQSSFAKYSKVYGTNRRANEELDKMPGMGRPGLSLPVKILKPGELKPKSKTKRKKK